MAKFVFIDFFSLMCPPFFKLSVGRKAKHFCGSATSWNQWTVWIVEVVRHWWVQSQWLEVLNKKSYLYYMAKYTKNYDTLQPHKQISYSEWATTDEESASSW